MNEGIMQWKEKNQDTVNALEKIYLRPLTDDEINNYIALNIGCENQYLKNCKYGHDLKYMKRCLLEYENDGSCDCSCICMSCNPISEEVFANNELLIDRNPIDIPLDVKEIPAESIIIARFSGLDVFKIPD